jgi:hypothetical protein
MLPINFRFRLHAPFHPFHAHCRLASHLSNTCLCNWLEMQNTLATTYMDRMTADYPRRGGSKSGSKGESVTLDF